MHIIANILWIAGLLFAFALGTQIRHKAKTEKATEKIFEVHALLSAVSVILIQILSLSPFHLLWMLPLSFLLGPLSLLLPLNLLLWPIASFYGSLWYIGVKRKETKPTKQEERGFKGGLVSRVRNKHSNKKYLISTAQELGRSYWSSVIVNSKLFGLWGDFYHPLYTFIRNNKEDAYDVHTALKRIVEIIPEPEWLESLPNPSPSEGYSEDAKEILKKLGL